jgi:hypothetical protein
MHSTSAASLISDDRTGMSITYAMACTDVYSTYGGDSYLTKAISLWEMLQETQVTPADVARGQRDGYTIGQPRAKSRAFSEFDVRSIISQILVPVTPLVGAISNWVSLTCPAEKIRLTLSTLG